MALATLSIDLVAQLANLQTGFDKATRMSEKTAADMDRRLGAVRGGAIALGSALASAFTVAGITSFVRATTDGLDALNDLKDATGASIENISALEDVAARTGTSFESMSSSLVKFNKVLSDSKPGSAAANTLAALGLSAEELKRIDPAEALRQTAVALSGFADDGNKARIVQELFGKSVKEAAPFLKDLAEQSRLVGTVTTEQAQAAEDFNKQLFQLQKNSIDLGRALVSDLLPALNTFAERLKGIKEAGGISAFFGSVGNEFKANLISEEIASVVRDIETLQKRLDFGASGSEKTGIERRMTALRAEFMRLQTEAGKTRDALVGFSNTVAPPDADYSNEGRTRPRPSLGDIPGATKPSKSKKEAKEQFFVDTSAIDELIERQKELNALLDSTPTAKLEKQRNLQLDLAAAYEDGRLGIVGSQEALDKYLEAVATGLPEAIETAREELKTLTDESNEFFKEAAANIQSAFGDTLKRTIKGDFDSIADLWADLLLDMAAQAAAAPLNKELFGADYGSTGKLGGLLGSIFGQSGTVYGGAGTTDANVIGDYAMPAMSGPQSAGSGRLSVQRSAPVVNQYITNNIGDHVTPGQLQNVVEASAAKTKSELLRTLNQRGSYA